MTDFQTTPEREATRALSRFRDELARAEVDAYQWKWALIAGHNAIQNFMVCALDSPGRENLFSPRYNKEFGTWWHDMGGKGEAPAPFMAVFMELYRRLEAPIDAFDDMKAMNEWRNEFIHFLMSTWVVSVRPLPIRFLSCLRVIEYCGWQPGRFDWDDTTLQVQAQLDYEEAVSILERLRGRYEG